jgi:hypothetical protein
LTIGRQGVSRRTVAADPPPVLHGGRGRQSSLQPLLWAAMLPPQPMSAAATTVAHHRGELLPGTVEDESEEVVPPTKPTLLAARSASQSTLPDQLFPWAWASGGGDHGADTPSAVSAAAVRNTVLSRKKRLAAFKRVPFSVLILGVYIHVLLIHFDMESLNNVHRSVGDLLLDQVRGLQQGLGWELRACICARVGRGRGGRGGEAAQSQCEHTDVTTDDALPS